MKFLIDAQLPRRLARWLQQAGHDALHTLDLAQGNRTPDAEIVRLGDDDERIVVTKDADFVNSFTIAREPRKLLLISTGNISNAELTRCSSPTSPQLCRRSKRRTSSSSPAPRSSFTSEGRSRPRTYSQCDPISIVSRKLSIPSPLWYCSLMAINVSREFEAELQTRLKSGPYRSAEEFLRAKIRLADEYAEQIRAAIAEGAAQADRGELIPGNQVFAELDQLILDVERAKPEE